MVRQSYVLFKEVVTKAQDKYLDGSWTDKNAKVYIKRHGINEKFNDEIMEHAYNMKTYREAERNQDANPEHWGAVSADAEINPAMFETWKFPATWDRPHLMLDQHVDAIMHLIFLGVAK
jgi:hypothetical protein